MKKLVFAAIAAMVLVSVSNVFAGDYMMSANVAPEDTVKTDTVKAPASLEADTTAVPADTTKAPADTVSAPASLISELEAAPEDTVKAPADTVVAK